MEKILVLESHHHLCVSANLVSVALGKFLEYVTSLFSFLICKIVIGLLSSPAPCGGGEVYRYKIF